MPAYSSRHIEPLLPPAVVVDSPPRPVVVDGTIDRRFRQQWLATVGLHGFLGNIPPNGVLPQKTLVVENDDRRRRRYEPLPPTVLNGLLATVLAPLAAPPQSINVDRPERRRAVEVVAFLSGVLAALTSPAPAPQIVEQQLQRARYRTPDPVMLSGALGFTVPPTTVPPQPLFVPAPERARPVPLAPAILNGLLAGFTGSPSASPLPVVVDAEDRRHRIPTEPPVSLSGILSSLVPPPPVVPPGPFVVSQDERRRFLAALPPTSTHGFDTKAPPTPEAIEGTPDLRRYRALDPLVLSGALAHLFPPTIAPPEPVVVIGEDGRRRVFPQPIVLFGGAFPATIIGAIYTQRFGPPNPDPNDFDASPRGNRLGGGPDDNDFAGAVAGNAFQGKPRRG